VLIDYIETIGKSADEGEQFFVESIKAWVDALGLQRFRLAGHSMGAFLSALFTLKYPQYVERLVLADPWGGSFIFFLPFFAHFLFIIFTILYYHISIVMQFQHRGSCTTVSTLGPRRQWRACRKWSLLPSPFSALLVREITEFSFILSIAFIIC